MAANYMQSVPKLKGRENYDEWCFAAENLLVLEGMIHYIKPVAGTESKAADDAKTKAKLILTIDPGLYVHIKETISSADLWRKLKNMFSDSGFSRKITLLRHLISIRQENCETMTTYVTQVVDTAQRLKGTGFTITDEWIGSLLLAGLPDKFSPMIMAIEHSGIQLTTDCIKTKLIDMEVPTPAETDSGGAAFAARKPHFKTAKYNTSKDGGFSAKTKMRGEKIITCFKCKEIGHYRNQCPLLQKRVEVSSCVFSVVFLDGAYGKSEWYVDSGASAHMTCNNDWIANGDSNPRLPEIIVANDTKVPVLCSGDVQITTGCNYNITVKDVLCVPSLTTNLLSVSELIKNGNNVVFEASNCYIRNKVNELVATASLNNGVYKLDIKTTDCLLAAPAVANAELWHRRLAHINISDLKKMKNGTVDGLSYPEETSNMSEKCVTCCEGKAARLPFSHVGQRSSDTLQIIHADVCGSMETKSIGGAQYFLLFVDDHSRMTFIYFLKHKNQVFKQFKEFKAMVENQQNKKIKILRTDNGGEFCSSEMENYLAMEGIIHQKTTAYTPEQNGVCERANRTVVEKARCLLFDAKLEKKFWAEAAHTAVYLKNRSVSSSLVNKTPYEAWYGKKPDMGHIRLFGSLVMAHIPKERRLKWDKKAEQYILIGFSENVKGYRLYDPRKNCVTVKRDVTVLEGKTGMMNTDDNVIWIQNEEATVNDHEIPATNEVSEIAAECRDSVGESQVNESLSSESSLFYTDSEADDTLTPVSTETTISDEFQENNLTDDEQPESKRTRRPPERFGFSNMCVSNNAESEQILISEALNGPEATQWRQAMREELQSFEYNDAWELADIPSDASIVQCKWVFNKKLDVNDKVRYRARLVAKGFTQRRGIDYLDTFSPVVKHSTLRMLFALSVQWGMDITHLDVTTAFLNGHLKENIYMSIPEGFVNESKGKVLKLKKAIYGLKQSSLVWYEKVKDCLCKQGFKNSELEPCLFHKTSGNVKVIVTVYVDDFLIFSNCAEATEKLKTVLGSEFKLKDLGSVRRYLGMRINVDKESHTITVDQQQYIEQLLTRFDMSDCRSIDTPIECKLNIEKSEQCVTDIPYQRLIGSLMYLAVLTRPDIAYSVSYLSQFNNCYNATHYSYAKRVLKYLQKTKHYCLKYSRDNVKLNGFVDADWASDSLDRKSYTGYCFTMCGSVISWQSRKQKTVSLSSTEAEYVALSEASREAIYLRNLLYEISGSFSIIKLHCDNQSALKLAVSHQSHNRSKHIDVRYHFVRDAVRSNLIEIQYTSTQEMPADLLTKGLMSNKHYKFMSKIGVIPK